jgi:PAN domain
LRNTTDEEMQMVKRTIRKLMISPLMLLAVMLGYSQDAGADGPYSIVVNQIRRGQEFTVGLQTVNAAECRQACAMEGECRAWTFYGGEHPERRLHTCILQSSIARPHYNTCCSSGIKPPPPAVKAGRDRPPPHVEGMARADPPPPVVKR